MGSTPNSMRGTIVLCTPVGCIIFPSILLPLLNIYGRPSEANSSCKRLGVSAEATRRRARVVLGLYIPTGW